MKMIRPKIIVCFLLLVSFGSVGYYSHYGREVVYQVKWHYFWKQANKASKNFAIDRKNIDIKIPGYSQGGIVVDGTAYLAANQDSQNIKPDNYPFVASFDLSYTLERQYVFENTYDSTPLIMTRRDGRRLILAHEYQKSRTKAIDLATGETVWLSPDNQPGQSFFGYSYFQKSDGTFLILVEARNGLHAISLETGEEVWWVKRSKGVTPAVDQQRGIVYYQSRGHLDKIDAITGQILATKKIDVFAGQYSTATMLVNDKSGYHVVTFWYDRPPYDSSIRVYDENLNVQWEKTNLAGGPKTTLSYGNGRVYFGAGDFSFPYSQNDTLWKYLSAFDVQTGDVLWSTNFASYAYDSIPNVIYVNEMVIAETQSREYSHHFIFVLDAKDGRILKSFDAGVPASSCSPPLFSGGKLYSGNLYLDSFGVFELGYGKNTDWLGAFGDPQLHHMAAPPEALIKLYDTPRIVSY